MKRIVLSNELPPEFLTLLGLPKHLVAATIHVEVNQPVIVDCTFYPEIDPSALSDYLNTVSMRYALTEQSVARPRNSRSRKKPR